LIEVNAVTSGQDELTNNKQQPASNRKTSLKQIKTIGFGMFPSFNYFVALLWSSILLRSSSSQQASQQESEQARKHPSIVSDSSGMLFSSVTIRNYKATEIPIRIIA